jgi:hypothetical protein
MGASNTDTAPGARQAAETAGQEGQDLARNAADSTRQVAETAKQQTGEMIQEASTQARDFAAQARTVVTEQADQQRQRLAGTLRDSGRELSEFASGDAQSPITTELTRRAGGYAQTVGDYLENADPHRILNDVRSFARRRPGAFLLIAAIGGAVAGRLTRGVASAQPSDTPSPSKSASSRAPAPAPAGLSAPEPPGGTTYVAPVVDPDQPPITRTHVVDPDASGRGGTGLADQPASRPDPLP